MDAMGIPRWWAALTHDGRVATVVATSCAVVGAAVAVGIAVADKTASQADAPSASPTDTASQSAAAPSPSSAPPVRPAAVPSAVQAPVPVNQGVGMDPLVYSINKTTHYVGGGYSARVLSASRTELGELTINFESVGRPDLNDPRGSCITTSTGGTYSLASFDLPVETPGRYAGTLTFIIDNAPATYRFNYGDCGSGYPPIELFRL